MRFGFALQRPSVYFGISGFDRVVHWSQSEDMKELLRGIGLEDVKARVYTTGHTGILTGESRYVCYDRHRLTDLPCTYRPDES